jgi:Flp pilus assembly protein TadD
VDLDFPSGHTALAEICRREGKYSEAIVESKTAAQLSSNNPNSLADVGLTYAASGGRTHALEILRELQSLSLSRTRYVVPTARGRVL